MTTSPPSNERLSRKPRFFISYCVDDKKFVFDTCNMLEPYFGGANMFLFEKHAGPDDFLKRMLREVEAADALLAFVGQRWGEYPAFEFAKALDCDKKIWVVGIGRQKSDDAFPPLIRGRLGDLAPYLRDDYTQRIPPATAKCAEDVIGRVREWWWAYFDKTDWEDWDPAKVYPGLPSVPQLFDYEKELINFYSAKRIMENEIHGPTRQQSSPTPGKVEELRSRWSDEKINEKLKKGVPAQWPDVYRYPHRRENRLKQEQAGDVRDKTDEFSARVRVAALMGLDPLGEHPTFPEAGPRRQLAFPNAGQRELNVAVLVAGGIAPGINAVIDAIVQRHHAYRTADDTYRLNIYGVKNGFLAISGENAALSPHLVELLPPTAPPGRDGMGTVEYATRGGSMLGTSRDDELLHLETRYTRLTDIANALSAPGRTFDILYVICGDGGMKAAHALWHRVNRDRSSNRPLSVVTVPKTMDNDILWVWQSFGFLSAVDESRRIVETLYTEVRSNPRLGIVQLFGSDSGFVVSHAVLASAAGHAMLAVIPEIKFSALGVARYLKRALWESADPERRRQTAPIDLKFPHGLVVMAENAVPLDALECLGLTDPPECVAGYYKELGRLLREKKREFRLTADEEDQIRAFVERQREDKPFEGQTSDTIRKLGLHVMAETIPCFLRQSGLLGEETSLKCDEPDWSKLRVVCSEPRHLVRSLEPSTSDIINGQRLGLLAVDAAMAGYTDCMISQWLTEFTVVPLDLVVLGRKRVPAGGMFWKSVISKTGQVPDLVDPYPKTISSTQS